MKKKTGIFLVFLFFLIFSFQIYFSIQRSEPKSGWSDDFFVADGGLSNIIQTEDDHLMIGFKKQSELPEYGLYYTSSGDGKE